jgi:hypothetical protein
MSEAFPRLTQARYRSTSPSDLRYNCVAWAAEDSQHWWQPGFYWPVPASRDDVGIDALEKAFQSLGYESCLDESLEPGFEKIALYGFGFFYTHAARQLANGRWTSNAARISARGCRRSILCDRRGPEHRISTGIGRKGSGVVFG